MNIQGILDDVTQMLAEQLSNLAQAIKNSPSPVNENLYLGLDITASIDDDGGVAGAHLSVHFGPMGALKSHHVLALVRMCQDTLNGESIPLQKEFQS